MNIKEVVQWAKENKTVIPAFNIPYLPMVKPVIQAIVEEDAIGMVQVARLEWEKFQSDSLEKVAEEYAKYAKEGFSYLHLDHVPVIDEDDHWVDFLPIIERAIKARYQSVMVDGSRLPFRDNIKTTKEVTALAHLSNVSVEAELGCVAGHESGGLGLSYEELFNTKKGFTDVHEAKIFVEETTCDWLSVAVGSIHGAIAKETRRDKKPTAILDIQHIVALSKATNHIPLVLHGGSGIDQEYILKGIEKGIAKINVGTEIRQAYEFALDEKPGDVEYARQKVFERTVWLLREFFKVSENYNKLHS